MWTEEKNRRRHELVDIGIDRGFTDEEMSEMNQLDIELFEYRRKADPLPSTSIPIKHAIISEMVKECHSLAKEKGWYDKDRNPLELIALIHSELGEATESIRESAMSEKISGFSGLEEELADTIIRIFDMAGCLDLDIAGAILAKHEYNKSRPYRHGGKAY